MFAVFTCHPANKQGPRAERMTPWPATKRESAAKRVALLLLVVFLFIASVVGGVLGACHPGLPAHVVRSTAVWGTGGNS